MPGLVCGTQDVFSSRCGICSCCVQVLVVAACELFNCSIWDLVPQPRIEPRPLTLGAQSQPLDHQGTSFPIANVSICFKCHRTMVHMTKCSSLYPPKKTQVFSWHQRLKASYQCWQLSGSLGGLGLSSLVIWIEKSQYKGRVPLLIFGCARSSLLCGLFSSCGKWGLLSSCIVWASHCSGFSSGAKSPGHVGFYSCSSRGLECTLSSCDTWT